MLQHQISFTTAEGTKVEYECALILSFVEEDGELKVLDIKDFADPEKRRACYPSLKQKVTWAVCSSCGDRMAHIFSDIPPPRPRLYPQSHSGPVV